MISEDTQVKLKVWYDADCPLCRREISLMKRLDRDQRIDFIDLHNLSDCPVAPEQLLQRLHAQEPQGMIISGAAAFAAMWRNIPLLRPLGLAAKWPPLLQFLEWSYVKFLKLRPRLQRLLLKTHHC